MGIDMMDSIEFSNPRLEATLLLEKLLNVDKIYIYTHGKKQVSKLIVDEFIELIKIRKGGYPLQYILGEWEFMGLKFYLEEGVLIPRSDTEILVEYILDYMDKNYRDKAINFLDLGIGSGAIALSIAYYNKRAQVYGVDNYDIPFKIANINKERLGLKNVKLYKGDLFEGLEEMKFHIIASNPPYIPDKDIKTLQKEVKYYEPITALAGGEDGLDFYRKIIPKSKDYLNHEGLLILEIGYDQGLRVKKIFKNEGYKDIGVLKDLQGLDRVVYGII